MFALKLNDLSRRWLRRALVATALVAATFSGAARLRGQPVASAPEAREAPAGVAEPLVAPSCAECSGIVDSLLPLSAAGRVREAIY